jgi:hypothetical protein
VFACVAVCQFLFRVAGYEMNENKRTGPRGRGRRMAKRRTGLKTRIKKRKGKGKEEGGGGTHFNQCPVLPVLINLPN